MGTEVLDWRAIADHFRRSVQAVRSRYRHAKVMGEGSGGSSGAGEPKRGGGGARKQISYGWMALYALSTLPDRVRGS